MSLPDKWEETKRGWERRIEDVLIEMTQQKTEAGIAILVDINPIAAEFCRALNTIQKAMERNELFIKLGSRDNEE